MAGMKVSVVRNRFREDKIFKGRLNRVNALINGLLLKSLLALSKAFF